jgi:hypothetical protein
MAQDQKEKNKRGKLTRCFLIYLSVLAGFALCVCVCDSFYEELNLEGLVAGLMSGYFFCGVILSRSVLKYAISWHPHYNTLKNVSKRKMKYLILWPVMYPVALIRLAIFRHL